MMASSQQPQSTDPFMTLTIHKRQSNAAVGGLMAILTYGSFFMWEIYILYVPNQWAATTSRGGLIAASVGLFIGTIIGSPIGYWLVGKFRKVYIYAVADVLTIISGALFIFRWETIVGPAIACYLGGITQGIAMVVALVHTPEVATKNLRGAVVSVVSCMVATSLFVSPWLFSVSIIVDDASYMEQYNGGLAVFYGALGLLCLKWFTLESPVFLIKNNQEQDAYNTLKRLRLETHDTYELVRDFQELKDLINDEKCLERVRLNDKGLFSFLRILLLRILYTISTSMVLIKYQLAFSMELSPIYGFGILMSVRFVTELLALYWLEKLGRRKLLFISSTVCGLILVLSAFITFAGTSVAHTLIALAVFAIIYQAVVGFGLGPVSCVYASELFSLKRKAASIMAILMFESFLQIVLVLINEYTMVNLTAFFIITGALQICGGIYLYKTLPETKGLSLRECLHAL